MKKNVIMLLAVILTGLMGLTSCGGNETEKKLNGKWEFSQKQAGADTRFTIDFDAASHNTTFIMTVGMPEMKDAMKITLNGTWSADPEQITINFDNDSMTSDFSDEFLAWAQKNGQSKEAMHEYAKQSMSSTIHETSMMKIESLTADTLEISENGIKMAFTRQ